MVGSGRLGPLTRHPIFALTDTSDALSYVNDSPAIPALGTPSKALYFRVTSPLTVVMSLTSLPASTVSHTLCPPWEHSRTSGCPPFQAGSVEVEARHMYGHLP